MRIATLLSSYEGSQAPFAALDSEFDPSRYAPEHQWTVLRLRKATAVAQITEAARGGFDVFLNLCDGAWDEDRAGIEVVMALERLGLPFTGAGSRFYDPSRTAMKMAAHSVGVGVPPFVVTHNVSDVPKVMARLRFPMLVKHPQGYSSVGLTPASLVRDVDALARQISQMVADYGSALVEEFIEGREFTVLVADPGSGESGPRVYTPVECVFPPGETFKHFDLKWRDFNQMRTEVVADGALNGALREAAARVYEAIGGSGYGRCDFRVDARGDIQFLEINPNCSLFYPDGQFGSGDLVLANDPGGHRGFVRHILECAERRRLAAQPSWRVEYGSASGFGIVASRALAAGDVAVRYEEQPQRLVSRAHVERQWRGRQREWFDRYAWPMSKDVFAVWSSDPEEWCPINHSCDPNTWLVGLDLVARRDVPVDEPLTVDYATFCGPDMTPFECRCGTGGCRRVVRGSDGSNAELRARFGDHVSDFVRAVATSR